MKQSASTYGGLTALASAALVACSGGGDGSPDGGSGIGGYQAVVQRTSFGIPHVKADDWGGLGYGYGYAFAQDNLCVLAERLVTVQGRRALHFGEAGNLNSDFFYRYVQDEAKVRRLFTSLSADLQAMVRGYAAGYNRYLRDTGVAQLPAACRNAEWVRPIDELDLMRHYHALTLRASSENQMSAIVAAQPPAAQVGPNAFRRVVDVAPLQRPELLGIGSNAIALGREATTNGSGMLLGNPHFPWQGSERLYEVHLTLPGKLDVMGASLFGVPLVNIGFNRDVAWSHTVSTAFRFTPYALTLAPGNPTAYVYDGQVRPMTAQTVQVEARQPDGSVAVRSHTFYRTHYGPMIVNPALSLTWSATTAYAIRDANAENGRFLEQFARLNRATSVDDVRRALGEVIGLPWVNTVATDRLGHAFYADISVVPNVSAGKIAQCVNSPVGRSILQAARLPVLDGSTSACEWEVDPAAPQAGIFSINSLPYLTRGDYVTNSNDSYWLANPAQPLTGFSPIIGPEGTARTLRTRLGLRLVQERLGSTGAPGANRFGLEDLQALLFSNRNHAGELVVDAVVGACGSSVTLTDGSVVDIAPACQVLAQWDRKVNVDSVGAHVFREFWSRASAIGGLFAVPFSVTDPVNTPHTPNVGNPDVLLRLRQALGAAVQALAANGIPLERPWGQVQYVERNGARIPIHGGADREGVFNVITSVGLSPAGYAAVVHGTSYVQTVTFEQDGPRAEALLTYAQSTDSASPHFSDQTMRYSNKQWIRLPFQQDEISSDPNLRTVTISE